MKTIKLLFTVLLLLCATVATAYDFDSQGIYYNITSDKTVKVTYNYGSKYTGIVRIPSSVTYNGTVYSVTSIGYRAFYGCTGLTSIEIPNSVTSIGDNAFYECEGLTSIEIPNSVTSIGYSAFAGCTGLTSIEIPNSVTSIGNSALAGCTGLTSIEIPNSVTTIGKYAFAGCTGLTSIVIGNSITSIGDWAFNNCTGLTSIEIPNSVTSIGDEAFRNCTGLTSIMVDKNNPVYDSRDNCNAIIETASNTLICACQNTIIPNSVTSIGDYAFQFCFGLTSIEIPNSITSIGDKAFGYCTGLTSIEIPNSVTSIGDYAFYECTGLTSIEIPNSVTSIGDYAFRNCTGLTSIVIGNSITRIGDFAFYDCNNIFEIKIGLKEAISASETIFSRRAYNNACLYVPVGSKDSYAKTSPWSYFYIKEMDFTGIENVLDDIKGENGNTKTIYNLNGCAVENPTKGIYIINGKKVLVK